MAYWYPVEQYFVGIITGGILSWVAASFYFDNDREDSKERSWLGDLATGKNVIVYVVDDACLDKFKEIIAPTMNSIAKSTISSDVSEPSKEPKPSQKTKDGEYDMQAEINDMLATALKSGTLEDKPKNITTETESKTEKNKPSSGSVGVGAYAAYKALDSDQEIQKNAPPGALSRKEEMSIINSFKHLIGMGYADALELAREKGYNLYPLYLSYGPKMPALNYSPRTLGVRVKDHLFDSRIGQPSKDAEILEIVDVGGVDYKDHGMIKL